MSEQVIHLSDLIEDLIKINAKISEETDRICIENEIIYESLLLTTRQTIKRRIDSLIKDYFIIEK